MQVKLKFEVHPQTAEKLITMWPQNVTPTPHIEELITIEVDITARSLNTFLADLAQVSRARGILSERKDWLDWQKKHEFSPENIKTI